MAVTASRVRGATAGPVRVAPMRSRHLDAVHAIECAVYPRPWTPALFAGELGRHDRRYVVATRRREVVGYAGVVAGAGEAHVLTVAVDPAHQRSGVARHLVVELLGAAAALGAADVTLEVRESNLGAEALYRRFGFVSEGIRPRYYEDNGEGARIMWLRDLTSTATVARIREEARRLGRPLPDPLG